MTLEPHTAPLVPVSWGELLDKITILEIKADRIEDAAARANVARELALLREVAAPVLPQPGLAALIEALRSINCALWEIEDAIRARDAAARFDAEFIRLARAVYLTNDERAALKRKINVLLRSVLVEEKSYGRPPAAEPDAGGRTR
ncbi:hypothetical protein A6J80_20430 (plasmid) [Paracoccus yeei]|nr:DUF6165 family protein [Paracoccus yeei]ARC38682.1 hypothetical protein A6J80_20430 [Paracoccus yeei]ATQ58508.1 hypothetical protein PYTT13_22050 [Paracoccus yeei]MBY0136200.1 hypothetical protein [Paracoccus yeei]